MTGLRIGTKALVGLVGLILFIPAVSDAQVQVQPAPQQVQKKVKTEWFATQDGRPTPPPFVVSPNPPPTPAGCTPTKAQCAGENDYWKTNACATGALSAKAVKAHCSWQMQKAWSQAPVTPKPTVVPTTDPTTPFPLLASGRRVDHGKLTTFTIRPDGATKRGYSRKSSPNKPPSPSPPPRGTNFTPRVVKLAPFTNGMGVNVAGGTYASKQMGSIIGVQGQIDDAMRSTFDTWGPAASAQQSSKTFQMGEWVMATPPFVGPGAGINTCDEYAYKRWGNWSSFQYAAKKMSRWYRNIYKIAMDPESPVFINQSLKQVGTNTPTPASWRDNLPGEKKWRSKNGVVRGTTYPVEATDEEFNDPFIPANPFYSIRPDWLGDEANSKHAKLGISKTDADKIRQAWSGRPADKRRIKAKNGWNDNDPLAMHREAKQRLDTVYGNPLDEELADIAKRTKTYLDLGSRRVMLLEKDACTKQDDPCWLCHPRPPIPPGVKEKAAAGLGRPAGIQKVIEQISGMARINPNPVDMQSLFNTGSPSESARALNSFNVAESAIAELAVSVGRTSLGGGSLPGVNSGGFKKQKIDVFGQIKPTNGPPPVNTVNPNGANPQPNQNTANATTIVAQCMADLMATKPVIAAALDQVEKDLTAIALNEVNNPKGCLINPGPNLTNACDWNYEYFASLVTDTFSARLQNDVSACDVSVNNSLVAQNMPPTSGSFASANGFAATVKTAAKQAMVFPCVQRRNFSTSAPEVEQFILKNGSLTAEQCEVERQNQSLLDIQAQYADYFKGMEWNGGSGKVQDGEDDNMEIAGDTLGGKLVYATSWDLQRTKTYNNTSDTMKGCGFEGGASQTASANVFFLGDNIELAYTDAAVKARSNPGAVKHVLRWKDLDSGQQRLPTIDRSFLNGETVTRRLPYTYLADVETEFWIVILEFPVRIKFGFSAATGMDFTLAGNSGSNCNDASQKSPTNYRARLEAKPFVTADAFADASVNYPGVAAAGVRLDLNLIKFSLPMGVDIQNTAGENWSFRAGGSVDLDMLAGELSAYLSTGLFPLEVTVWVKLMGWDGFHESLANWGIDRAVPGYAVRALLAKFVERGNVACQPDIDNNSNPPKNAACSLQTQPGNLTQPCPSGNCNGAPEFKKVTGKSEWHLCRFNEFDRGRLTKYKDACVGYTR